MVNKKQVKGNKNVVRGIIIGAVTLGLIGGAFAYFSGIAEQKSNKFNIVNGEKDDEGIIEIEEPHWVEEKAVDLEPGEAVGKDPYIVSKAEYDGFMVARVTVPKINASLDEAGEDGQYSCSPLEAMKFIYGNVEYNDAGDIVSVSKISDYNEAEFRLIDTKVLEDRVEYYFGYTGTNCIFENGDQTEVIFNYIQVPDFTCVNVAANEDGSVPETAVLVDAQIIQTINPDTGVMFTAEDAWAKLMTTF